MKKSLILSLGGALLVLVALAVFVLPGAAPEAEAFDCYRCRCTNTFTSGSMTVGGPGWSGPASCAAANAQLQANLEASVGCDSFCSSNLVITTPCQMNDPKWYPVTGYLQYSCELCVDLCQ
jgi:hypothetical protein